MGVAQKDVLGLGKLLHRVMEPLWDSANYMGSGQQVFDEMRIELIAELATPAFHKDVDERLEAMFDRLKASKDLEKVEMVLLLR